MDEKVLKALGDAKRYHLLELMSQRSYCVRALARSSGLSEPAVSQHLRVLREAGLVYGVKRGYYTHYQVQRDALEAVIAQMQQLLEVQRKPCDQPFYGCPESEVVRCSSYVPPENRRKETEDLC